MSGIVNFLRAFLPKQSIHNALDCVPTKQNYLVPELKKDLDASPLFKYIYLSSEGAADKEKFIATCHKNFLVYIVTIETDAEDEDGSQSEREGVNKIAENVSLNADSKHIIESQSESSTFRPEYVQKNIKNKETVQKSNSSVMRFLRKILPSKSSKSKKAQSPSVEEIYVQEYNYEEDSRKGGSLNTITPRIALEKTLVPYMIHTAQIDQTYGEYSQADTHREITHLRKEIEESENYIKSLIEQYIQNKCVVKELLNAVTNHEHLLGNIETRTNDLNNDHWIHQIDTYKDQQKTLQNSMNSIIHQNRELLEENELLTKKNEKLSALVVSLQESTTNVQGKLSSKIILDDLSKNNDRLRHKVNSMLSHVDTMEETLKKYSKRCQFLQQQLNTSNSQLHNAKALCERSKTEFEMHLAKVNNELHSATSMIKEYTDQGNMILQDLEMLKIQLQPIAKTINWEKFQKCSRPLSELMHLSRTCINELSSALIYKHKELNMATSEIETLKLAHANMDLLKIEVHEFRTKLEQSMNKEKSVQQEVANLNEEITRYKKDIDALESTISNKDKEIEDGIKKLSEKDEEINSLNDLVLNNKEEFCQMQFATDKLRHENHALNIQVKGMAQVLNATGAGDIAKELANSQEKLTAVQTQFFALAAENNILLKQVETNKSERQTLVAYQKNCYEQLQVLHKNIEDLEKANEALKEQLETEKQTVNALQSERVRHLEERTILTAIYERLKSEISKVDQLEGAVSTMNKKASKLAMIAEYNKQLGEKLQIEVAEKDVAINELQNNVKQLNSFQMESTKEKVALCEELNKVFSVKEVLNTKLTAELEKNVILDESKKEIQNSANLQLKEIQAAYNREHAALKNLVQDVKQLVAERDELMQTNKESEAKCLNIMREHDKLVEFIKTFKAEYTEKEEKVEMLEKLVEKHIHELDALSKKSENDIKYFREQCEMSMKQNESFNAENEALKGSLEYLQSDISKLRSDLEHSRQNEHDYKKSLEELQNTYNNLYEEYRLKASTLKHIIEENEALKINVYTLNEKFKCLSDENQRVSQDSMRLESMLAEKFQCTKISGLPTPKHVENVLDDINARDEEILILQDKLREHEERAMEMNDLLQTISMNRNQLEIQHQQLLQELDSTRMELQHQHQHAEKLDRVIQEFQQNSVCADEVAEQHKKFNASIDSLKKQYEIQLQALEQEIGALQEDKQQNRQELMDVRDTVEQYKEAHEKLQKAHKMLALKLFTAVRVLICEKVAMETYQSKITVLEEEKQRLIKYTEDDQDEVRNLKQQLSDFQRELDETKCENAALFDDVTATRATLSELQNKISCTADRNDDSEEYIREQDRCITTLKAQLEESRKAADNLQVMIANLEAATASLEFEKSEADLRLHELQLQSQSESARNSEMKRVIQSTLTLIIEMKENGKIAPHVHNQLLQSFNSVRV